MTPSGPGIPSRQQILYHEISLYASTFFNVEDKYKSLSTTTLGVQFHFMLPVGLLLFLFLIGRPTYPKKTRHHCQPPVAKALIFSTVFNRSLPWYPSFKPDSE